MSHRLPDLITEPAVWSEPAFDEAAPAGQALVIGIEGFAGPLDLLLALARTQKVDLAKISVLSLVEQYLAFVTDAQKLNLELAADYLVMAAWLAYLKSRLLLPRTDAPTATGSAEEMAQRLSFRLMRLEAMRGAAAKLMTRHRLGRDVFARGQPEQIKTTRETTYTAEIFDLLKAYADQRKRTIKIQHVVKARRVWSIKDARSRLEKLIGAAGSEWTQLDLFLVAYLPGGEEGKSAIASSLGATLEMAREGLVDLRQDEPFAPIFMRRKQPGAEWRPVGSPTDA